MKAKDYDLEVARMTAVLMAGQFRKATLKRDVEFFSAVAQDVLWSQKIRREGKP